MAVPNCQPAESESESEFEAESESEFEAESESEFEAESESEFEAESESESATICTATHPAKLDARPVFSVLGLLASKADHPGKTESGGSHTTAVHTRVICHTHPTDARLQHQQISILSSICIPSSSPSSLPFSSSHSLYAKPTKPSHSPGYSTDGTD